MLNEKLIRYIYFIFLLNNQVLAQTVFHSVYKDLNSNIKLTNNSVTSDLNNFYISGETSELPAKVFYLSLDSMGQIIYSKKLIVMIFCTQHKYPKTRKFYFSARIYTDSR